VTALRVRTVIAEGEPRAQSTLDARLQGVDWIEVVGRAMDGGEALRQVDGLRPDLLFLDVQLPEPSGLEAIARIRHRPALVFRTAHDRFALTAFELGALDHLLKPFGRERFQRMLERVRERIVGGAAAPDAVEHTRLALGPPPREAVRAQRGAYRPHPGRVDPTRPGDGGLLRGPLRYGAHPSQGEPRRAALPARRRAVPPGPSLPHRRPGSRGADEALRPNGRPPDAGVPGRLDRIGR
jgi:CheY-like chemotaxis protein